MKELKKFSRIIISMNFEIFTNIKFKVPALQNFIKVLIKECFYEIKDLLNRNP